MKKLKLLISISTLCLAITVLCFGVFSAVKVSYSIGGTINYEIEDVFVKIKTKVYKSQVQRSTEELQSDVNTLAKTSLGSIDSNKNYTVSQEIDEFDSFTSNQESNSVSGINIAFGRNGGVSYYSYYIVINVENLSTLTNVYAVLGSNKDLDNSNLVVTSQTFQENILNGTTNRNVVIAYSVVNLAQGIDLSFDYTLSVKFGTLQNNNVTLDANGGTLTQTSSQAIYKSMYGSLPTPTRQGYTFVGWSLSNEYTELEYIETTGTQYIDTGYIPNQNSKFDITFMTNEANTKADCPFFGVRDGINSNAYTFWCHGQGYNGNESQVIFNDAAVSIGYFSLNKKYNLVISNGSCSLNNVSYSLASASAGAPKSSLILFGLKTGTYVDSRRYYGRAYDFKIYDSNKLVRNFVPALNNSTGVVGMYDKANNKFYANNGTGKFVGGSTLGVITNSIVVSQNTSHTLYAVWKAN